MNLRKYNDIVIPVIGFAVLSLVISFGFVEIFGRTVSRTLPLMAFVISFIIMVTIIIPFTAVALAIKRSFTPQPRDRQVVVIVLSFFAIMITFTGTYYSIVAFGDRIDASRKHQHYGSENQYLDIDESIIVRSDSRPFSGLGQRLWSGVDWPGEEDNHLRDRSRTPQFTDQLIENAKKPFDEVSEFQVQSRLNVFGELLYFSIVTMTTLGYGDITPTLWYTKLLASIQVLSVFLLIGMAMAMVIGDWWGVTEDN